MNYQRFSMVLIVGLGAVLLALVVGVAVLQLLPGNLSDFVRVPIAAAAVCIPILVVFLHIRSRLAQFPRRQAVSRRLAAAKISCSFLLLASSFASFYFRQSAQSGFASVSLGFSLLLVVALLVLLRVSWPWKAAA
jgi:hypothetical protein